jgi:hypothetical protein
MVNSCASEGLAAHDSLVTRAPEGLAVHDSLVARAPPEGLAVH